MRARQKGLGRERLGTVRGDWARVSWLESEGGAQRAVPRRVQRSARGPGAPETLVISVRMGASSPGHREGGGDPASADGRMGSDSHGGAPGSSGQPESPSAGCREPGEQGPADCWEQTGEELAEGGRSLYCAGLGGAASDSGGGGGKEGREGGRRTQKPGCPDSPWGSGLRPGGGVASEGALSFI